MYILDGPDCGIFKRQKKKGYTSQVKENYGSVRLPIIFAYYIYKLQK